MLRFVGQWCSFGAKLISLDGLGGVWMLGGGPGGRRRGVRGRNLRLRCGPAAMVSRGTWLRVVGGAGVCRQGASTGVHHLPSFWPSVAASVDVVSFLKAPSRAPTPCIAPGENLICGSDSGGYPWSYPSRRLRLGVLASSWSISPPRWLQVVLRSSYYVCLVVSGWCDGARHLCI
uniref:Uncharacterized protein n=1 Tax=Triticum urartu TaxID=4572 RepID=A0A8R7P9T7_TRIUA